MLKPVVLILSFAISGLLCAADPPPAAQEPKPAEAEVDPDVLRKVRKLIRGTLSEDSVEREKAWNGLKNMGNLAVPGLLGLYRQKETTAEMVRSILIALGDSKDPRAGPALVELLGNKEAAIRRDAARSLGDTGYHEGVAALEKIWTDGKEDEEVRLFAAVAGAKLGNSKSLDVLAALAKSEKAEIRSRAIFGLGKQGGVTQIGAIEGALGDSESSVREDAVEALRLLHRREAWGPLVKATGDADYRIRAAAMDALGELTGAKVEANSRAWQEWWAKQDKKPEKVKE